MRYRRKPKQRDMLVIVTSARSLIDDAAVLAAAHARAEGIEGMVPAAAPKL
jgi:hypothetical protein